MQFLILWIVDVKIRVNALLNISDFPWAECSMTENRVMYQTDSLSLKRSKRNTGVMRHEFELVTIDMKMTQGRGVKAKLSAAVDDTLLFVHPRLSYLQGTEPPSGIQIAGTNIAGNKTVDMNSAETWQLLAGDYIQFTNDTKVYECAEDTILQSGSQTVKLTNMLRNPVTTGTSIIVNGITWNLLSNGAIDNSMEASDDQDIELTLIAVEKL